MEVEALDESLMKTKPLPNQSIQGPRTDIGGTLGENTLKGLVKPMHKFVKLVHKISSKMQKPKTYNKAIHDPVYGNQ